MSIHFQLTPQAAARVATQRRNVIISSAIIALLLGALIGLCLYLIVFSEKTHETAGVIVRPGWTEEPHVYIPSPKITTSLSKPQPPAGGAPSRNIVSIKFSPTSIPSIPDSILPVTDFGTSTGIDTGISFEDGFENSAASSLLRSPMRKRCSREDRLQRLKATGGTPACEDAVLQALRFLKKTQNADGSWCLDHQVGMTALALLSYLGHCETASSEEFGDTVLQAIAYLTNFGMKNDGRLSSDFKNKHWPYEHAIATYALAETYTLCVVSFNELFPGLDHTVRKAGNFIIKNQHSSGGWDYAYSSTSARGGDTSLSGWHIQALKACKLTGLPFKGISRSSKAALAYFEDKQLPSGAIGYQSASLHGNQDGTTLAAVATLSFQIFGKKHHSLVRKATRFLDKNLKLAWQDSASDLYGHYYAAQALLNRGGTEWSDYNKTLLPQLIKHQNTNGSFADVATNPGSKVAALGALFKGSSKTNIHYRTTLATLTLETYYRYLPVSAQ